jgi:hypothetical protein
LEVWPLLKEQLANYSRLKGTLDLAVSRDLEKKNRGNSKAEDLVRRYRGFRADVTGEKGEADD